MQIWIFPVVTMVLGMAPMTAFLVPWGRLLYPYLPKKPGDLLAEAAAELLVKDALA